MPLRDGLQNRNARFDSWVPRPDHHSDPPAPPADHARRAADADASQDVIERRDPAQFVHTHVHTEAAPVPDEHADVHPCVDCRLPTSAAIGSYWLAPDELWDRVVGDQTIVLCPRCFHARARILGIAISWRAVEDEEMPCR